MSNDTSSGNPWANAPDPDANPDPEEQKFHTKKVSTEDLRGMLVIAKALAYAILTIEKLPPRWQEYSDKEDMKMILAEMSVFGPMAMDSAKHHLEGAEKMEYEE